MTEPAEKKKWASLINPKNVIEKGTPTRYHLKPTKDSYDKSESCRKVIFGQKDTNKPHKTILMVGETGTGKSTLINTMINFMLGVQREDKVWFEITDDQSDRTSVHSQTSSITVYEFYLQESKTDLTIIDTPGYGDTRGIERDKEIAKNLHRLSSFDDWVHKIDAVCLVIKSHQNRLCDRQQYIFNAVQSLFGKDIIENIVLLFTYSRGVAPKHALTAVKEAKIKCAVNEENQPVFFLFDNCQGETFDDEIQMIQKLSWKLSSKGMTGFFKFLDNIKPKVLTMTQDVLQKQKQLEENIFRIQSHNQIMEQQQNELKQAQEALEKNKYFVKNDKNFEFEVDVVYKEKVDIDSSLASVAMCCTVCEENCHYPGCWWVRDLSWCSRMKDYHCTVCSNKCHYTKHVKEAKIYVTKTKKEKRTNQVLKKEYDGKIKDGECLVDKLEEELQELEKEKIKLVMDAFHCVETLQMIALNTDPLIILLHIDFLIEEVKGIKEHEKAEIMENIKRRAGGEKREHVNTLQELINK